MTTSSLSLRLQSLIPTPSTIHADWRSITPSPQKSNAPQMLEIAIDEHSSRTICAKQHQCTSHSLSPDVIMLTTSTCQLLQVQAGTKLYITPVTLHHVQIDVDTQLPPNTSAISTSLAALLGVKPDRLLDLILCPSTYTATQQNVCLHIAKIREETQQATIPEENHPQVATNIMQDPSSTITGKQESQGSITSVPGLLQNQSLITNSSPRIWLPPAIASALGAVPNRKILLYVAPERSNSPQVSVIQHPGFCYLSSKEQASLKIDEEAIIELHSTSSLISHVQIHSPLEEMEVSFVDETIANHLQIAQRSTITFTILLAKLYWLRKEKVDDIRNKARAEVRLSQESFIQGGYIHQESVRIFSSEGSYPATIEASTQSLSEEILTITSFLMRQAQFQPNQGVFLSTDHTSFLIAKVGILNVDEISSFSAKGSDKLTSLFKMPCLVELRNPQHGTSLDILLEPDPYPRIITLVRMSRTTRQMLLLERGQQVQVRPIPQTKENQPIRTLPLRILKAAFYRLLLLLIDRRRILVSIAPAHTWDDQAQVARIDAEALAVLGMEQGDRLRILYRGKSISRVTMGYDPDYKDPISTSEAKDAVYNLLPTQFQIGLDAIGRHKLGNGNLEFGTVVEVERDMSFILQKSLNLALLPIIGTIVAILAFFANRPLILQVVITIALASLLFYLALSGERTKVK
jgi:hypothetical protein